MTGSLDQILRKRDGGGTIVGAAVGSGFAGRCLSESGVDFLAVYSGSIMHMRGADALAGLLPLVDANSLTLAVGKDVVANAGQTPVFAGVAAWDPMRVRAQLLAEIRAAGFAGVVNFPTVGFYDGVMRSHAAEMGFSYDCEIELIASAREMGLAACAFTFTPEEAAAMAAHGAHIVLLAVPGSDEIDDAIGLIGEMCAAVEGTGTSPVLLCQGGALSEPVMVQEALSRIVSLDGFFGPRAIAVAGIRKGLQERLAGYQGLRRGPRHPGRVTTPGAGAEI